MDEEEDDDINIYRNSYTCAGVDCYCVIVCLVCCFVWFASFYLIVSLMQLPKAFTWYFFNVADDVTTGVGAVASRFRYPRRKHGRLRHLQD